MKGIRNAVCIQPRSRSLDRFTVGNAIDSDGCFHSKYLTLLFTNGTGPYANLSNIGKGNAPRAPQFGMCFPLPSCHIVCSHPLFEGWYSANVSETSHLRALYSEILRVIDHCIVVQQRLSPRCTASHEQSKTSAINLCHYLGLRQLDLRKLQVQLGQLGLSSLGRSEGHVLSTLQKVAHRIADTISVQDPMALRCVPCRPCWKHQALMWRNSCFTSIRSSFWETILPTGTSW